MIIIDYLVSIVASNCVVQECEYGGFACIHKDKEKTRGARISGATSTVDVSIAVYSQKEETILWGDC